MTPEERWTELRGRLTETIRRLQEVAKRELNADEKIRLEGKVEGAKLALSYMRDYDKENL